MKFMLTTHDFEKMITFLVNLSKNIYTRYCTYIYKYVHVSVVRTKRIKA